MSELKDAILDAKYMDMVSLADFVVRDCALPDMDEDGTQLPQQNEIAAAIFRWAAMQGEDADSATSPSGSTAASGTASDTGAGPWKKDDASKRNDNPDTGDK